VRAKRRRLPPWRVLAGASPAMTKEMAKIAASKISARLKALN
jgi:hypothetical protein